MRAHWVAVASAEHVLRGLAGGFMQVCHGKGGPLRRIRPGDGVVYYSPTVTLGGAERCQTFTAIGVVQDAAPHRVDMGGGFQPFRRDVAWWPAEDAAVRPLLDDLAFTAGKANWGYQFRFGLLAIGAPDFGIIASAMNASDRYVMAAA